MVSVTDLAATLQPLFTTVADHAAHHSGFIRRKRTLTGAAFVQSLVFGWLGNPDACLLYTSPSPRDPKTSRMPSSA